jgi:DNA-binding CsgD family transcriptional regulator
LPGGAAAVCLQHGYAPAEGRLSDLLARDHELNEASQRMGVTYGTAQSYLKAVFDKTGVHSQAQLVSRLLGAAH